MANMGTEATMLRLAAVEAKVQVKGWSASVIAELVSELGVDQSTVYNDWNRIKRMTRRFVTTDLEKQRREQMAVLDSLIIRAMNAGDFAAAASAMKVKGQITGTIAPAGKVDVHLNNSTTYNAAVAMVGNLSIEEQHGKVDDLIASRGRLNRAIEAQSTLVVDEPTTLDKG